MRITSDEQFQEEYKKLQDLPPDVADFIRYAWRNMYDEGEGTPDINEMIEEWYNPRQESKGLPTYNIKSK